MASPGVDAVSDMQAQEKALRRSRKEAREKIASNALIRAAGSGESPQVTAYFI